MNVNIDKLPMALQIASELGLTGDSEDTVIADAWKRLTPADKKFISGMMKGMLIGMAESPVKYEREVSR